MGDEERTKPLAEFRRVVNTTSSELEHWLGTAESRAVGMKHEGEDEAVGHKSGRRIVALKRTCTADLTEDDYAHMRKVAGYVHRHLKQGRPKDDKEHSRWRYSLMNWGHDPHRSD